MKKLLSCLVVFAALCTGVTAATAKEWKDIRIGYEGAYPPFSQIGADGKPSGFDIDIVQALCAQMKANCTLVQVNWDGLIPALQAQKIDAIVASMAITAERKQQVDFTQKYYNSPRRLVAAKSSPIKDLTPETLKGKRIGVQRGTLGDKYATAYWLPLGVQVVKYATQDDVYLDLRAGRIDAALQDAAQAYTAFLRAPISSSWATRSSVLLPNKRPCWAKDMESRCARVTTICASSSTRRLTQSALTARTNRSTRNTSTSISIKELVTQHGNDCEQSILPAIVHASSN
jgi:lysine-arginine-ornithine-binding protein